ncbi:thermonuclease family protein [Erysipelothrix sp. HDW6C]|nr:thermonuclease family protein [Erysipelothrix sp. HDW6C]
MTDVHPHEVVRCIDGDTFAYGEQTIRLLAIDTPETVKPNTPVEPYGKEASDYTCSAITSAEVITLKQDTGNEKDKYGRTLAWVYVDDVLLQELLLSEGLAAIKYVDKKTVDPILLATLKVAESNAQAQRLKLWSD